MIKKAVGVFFMSFLLLGGVWERCQAIEVLKDATFCLVTCTESYCQTSQENFVACSKVCRGKYDALVKGCILGALDAKHFALLSEVTAHSPEAHEEKDDKKNTAVAEEHEEDKTPHPEDPAEPAESEAE